MKLAKMQTLPMVGPAAYQTEIKAFNNYLHSYSGSLTDAVKQYLKAAGKKFSASTVRVKKFALKKAIEATATDMVSLAAIGQVFKSIKAPKPDSKVRRHEVLNKDELASLIEAASLKTGLVIRALVTTGLRISELLNIRLKDCKLKGSRAYMTVLGKGGKERQVSIDRNLFAEITAVYRGETYLFETRNGMPLDRSNLWRDISIAGAAIGREDIHPHTFRHTFATAMLERSSLKAVSQYLGHSSMTTTAAFYIHDELLPEQIESVFAGVA